MAKESAQQAGKHDQSAFLNWLDARGVRLSGLHAEHIPGRGFGVRASRNLKEGERLVYVPANTLVTIDSKLVSDLKLPNTMTVHGRIATALAVRHSNGEDDISSWTNFWPSMDDFRSMPILWNDSDIKRLPESTQSKLSPLLHSN